MWNSLVGFGLALLQETAPASPAATPLPTSEGGGFGSFLWLMLGIGIGIAIGLLLSRAFGKSRNVPAENGAANLSVSSPSRTVAAVKSATLQAKRCPVCNSTYTDEALIYCVSDGTTLVGVDDPRASDPNATMLYRDSVKWSYDPPELRALCYHRDC